MSKQPSSITPITLNQSAIMSDPDNTQKCQDDDHTNQDDDRPIHENEDMSSEGDSGSSSDGDESLPESLSEGIVPGDIEDFGEGDKITEEESRQICLDLAKRMVELESSIPDLKSIGAPSPHEISNMKDRLRNSTFGSATSVKENLPLVQSLRDLMISPEKERNPKEADKPDKKSGSKASSSGSQNIPDLSKTDNKPPQQVTFKPEDVEACLKSTITRIEENEKAGITIPERKMMMKNCKPLVAIETRSMLIAHRINELMEMQLNLMTKLNEIETITTEGSNLLTDIIPLRTSIENLEAMINKMTSDEVKRIQDRNQSLDLVAKISNQFEKFNEIVNKQMVDISSIKDQMKSQNDLLEEHIKTCGKKSKSRSDKVNRIPEVKETSAVVALKESIPDPVMMEKIEDPVELNRLVKTLCEDVGASQYVKEIIGIINSIIIFGDAESYDRGIYPNASDVLDLKTVREVMKIPEFSLTMQRLRLKILIKRLYENYKKIEARDREYSSLQPITLGSQDSPSNSGFQPGDAWF